MADALLEATDAIQQSLLTQDKDVVRAAIARFGHVLDGGSAQSRADLEVAQTYLSQLEQAAVAAASEYNAAVGELHQLIYGEAVDAFRAGEALQQLQAVAARAETAGAPEEMLDAAQEKANALHAAHVELLQAQAYAENQLTEGVRALQSHGVAAIEPLRQAHAYAVSVGVQSAVAHQAAAALDAAERHEAGRAHELAGVEASVRTAMAAVSQVLGDAVQTGEVLRRFDAAESLRQAIAHANAAGVDRALMYEASRQLAPIEAAELAHHNETQRLNEQLHAALAADDEEQLDEIVQRAAPLRPYLDAEVVNAASKRRDQFGNAHELAKSTAELKVQLDGAHDASGAAPLREALLRAEAAGLEGLLFRKASARLQELEQKEEAEQREAEAHAWMQKNNAAQLAAQEQRRTDEAARDEAKEIRCAEKRTGKAPQSPFGGGGGEDMLTQMAGAAAWEAHEAPDGRVYYHNATTGVTTWQRPADFDERRARAAPAVASDVYAAATGEHTDRASLQGLSSRKLVKFLRARGVEHDDDLDLETLADLAAAWADSPKVIWQKAKTPDGRVYWFNAVTKATSWTKPTIDPRQHRHARN